MAQNNGYATEAVKELIQWAFTTSSVKKVVAECLEDNTPSIKVLEKVGMKQISKVENMLKWELSK